VLVVFYPDEGLLNSKPKRWCCFYVFTLNLILFKQVKVVMKRLHQKSRNQRYNMSLLFSKIDNFEFFNTFDKAKICHNHANCSYLIRSVNFQYNKNRPATKEGGRKPLLATILPL